jgi:hypothetical protein
VFLPGEYIVIKGEIGHKMCRWCKCSCDVHLYSLHSLHAKLTISMQRYTLQTLSHPASPKSCGARHRGPC